MPAIRTTSSALHTLLQQAIDYAGLFPPASLNLHEAAAAYARYREGTESWMLGTFICPIGRLRDLSDLVPTISPPWKISALGTGGNDVEAYLRALSSDLRRINELTETEPSRITVTTLETRWPAASLDMRKIEREAFLRRIVDILTTDSTTLSTVFFELPVHLPGEQLEAVLQTLREVNQIRPSESAPMIGAKIRCGGTEAAAFPSAKNVTVFLAACVRTSVPFKATAGLHHPFYHHNAEMDVYMHGFVNVFLASVLLNAGLLDDHVAEELLTDGDASHFDVSAERISWRDYSVGPDEIGHARTTSILSFGSCSFDKPRDDLSDLGYL